jgi:hypothetical protein
MNEGTSIPLPPELFGFGKKLEGSGWAIGYRSETKTLNGLLNGNRVRVVLGEEIEFQGLPFIERSTDLWYRFADEEDFWEYTHTFDDELLQDYVPTPYRVTAATTAVCRCGKHKFTETAAQTALLNAKIARGLRGNKKRRECRVYICPTDRKVRHLTSRPDWNAEKTETV